MEETGRDDNTIQSTSDQQYNGTEQDEYNSLGSSNTQVSSMGSVQEASEQHSHESDRNNHNSLNSANFKYGVPWSENLDNAMEALDDLFGNDLDLIGQGGNDEVSSLSDETTVTSEEVDDNSVVSGSNSGQGNLLVLQKASIESQDMTNNTSKHERSKIDFDELRDVVAEMESYIPKYDKTDRNGQEETEERYETKLQDSNNDVLESQETQSLDLKTKRSDSDNFVADEKLSKLISTDVDLKIEQVQENNKLDGDFEVQKKSSDLITNKNWKELKLDESNEQMDYSQFENEELELKNVYSIEQDNLEITKDHSHLDKDDPTNALKDDNNTSSITHNSINKHPFNNRLDKNEKTFTDDGKEEFIDIFFHNYLSLLDRKDRIKLYKRNNRRSSKIGNVSKFSQNISGSYISANTGTSDNQDSDRNKTEDKSNQDKNSASSLFEADNSEVAEPTNNNQTEDDKSVEQGQKETDTIKIDINSESIKVAQDKFQQILQLLIYKEPRQISLGFDSSRPDTWFDLSELKNGKISNLLVQILKKSDLIKENGSSLTFTKNYHQQSRNHFLLAENLFLQLYVEKSFETIIPILKKYLHLSDLVSIKDTYDSLIQELQDIHFRLDSSDKTEPNEHHLPSLSKFTEITSLYRAIISIELELSKMLDKSSSHKENNPHFRYMIKPSINMDTKGFDYYILILIPENEVSRIDSDVELPTMLFNGNKYKFFIKVGEAKTTLQTYFNQSLKNGIYSLSFEDKTNKIRKIPYNIHNIVNQIQASSEDKMKIALKMFDYLFSQILQNLDYISIIYPKTFEKFRDSLNTVGVEEFSPFTLILEIDQQIVLVPLRLEEAKTFVKELEGLISVSQDNNRKLDEIIKSHSIKALKQMLGRSLISKSGRKKSRKFWQTIRDRLAVQNILIGNKKNVRNSILGVGPKIDNLIDFKKFMVLIQHMEDLKNGNERPQPKRFKKIFHYKGTKYFVEFDINEKSRRKNLLFQLPIKGENENEWYLPITRLSGSKLCHIRLQSDQQMTRKQAAMLFERIVTGQGLSNQDIYSQHVQKSVNSFKSDAPAINDLMGTGLFSSYTSSGKNTTFSKDGNTTENPIHSDNRSKYRSQDIRDFYINHRDIKPKMLDIFEDLFTGNDRAQIKRYLTERVNKYENEGLSLDKSIEKALGYFGDKILVSNAKWAKEAIERVRNHLEVDENQARLIISSGLNGFMGEIYSGLRKNFEK